MITNFLLFKKAFELDDWSLFIEKFTQLNEAILKAKDENKDVVLIQEDLLYLQIVKEDYKAELYEFISNYELDELQLIIPNLNPDVINALRIILSYPQESSKNLEELRQKYENYHNGLMGLDFTNIQDLDSSSVVIDIDTWFDFHFYNYHQNPDDKYFIQQLARVQGESFNEYFPNLPYSNYLFYDKTDKTSSEIWKLFYQSNKTKEEKEEYDELFGAGDRVAVIKELAPKIAYRNLYKFNEDLSNYNDHNKKSKKTTPFQIFEQGIGNEKVYLSTDFEKGAFELCNHKGNHLGEYFFDGEQNEEADPTGGHDILIN